MEYYKIIKTCQGRLVFTLVDPITNARQVITFESDAKQKIVPEKWAILVFADTASGAYKLYRAGYFTFDKPEEVFEAAKKEGYVFGDIDFTPAKGDFVDKVVEILKEGKKTEIEKLLDNPKTASDVVAAIQEHKDDINLSVIRLVENKLKVQLIVDGE